MRLSTFTVINIAIAGIFFLTVQQLNNDYIFFASYTILQFVVLSIAWNILGGYCGYVNFGTAAFFALGAYTSVFFHKTFPLPIPVLIMIAAVVSGLIGLGTGYLTLRLRGAFFSIATLAMAVVLQTLVVNWNYVGGSRGAYVIRPANLEIFGAKLPYIQYLFLIMLLLATGAIIVARIIEQSKLGYGFATIRDDELAAEVSGVPTLKLKLIATTLSGAIMGMAGAPFPYYIGYLEPASAFGLPYAVNAIAMPMIGGTTTWAGPLIGAILLGSIQQIATVTISSAVNLLIVGFLLVGFVIIAPNGLIGLLEDFFKVASPLRLDGRAIRLMITFGYLFIRGLLGIVFSIAIVSSAEPITIALSIAGLITSALFLASAYGLVKVQSWSPYLSIFAFVFSIALISIQILLNRGSGPLIMQTIEITIAIAGICYLQSREVQKLYRPKLDEQQTTA